MGNAKASERESEQKYRLSRFFCTRSNPEKSIEHCLSSYNIGLSYCLTDLTYYENITFS